MGAKDALNHDWFAEEPLPVKPEMFPTWPAKSEGGKHPPREASPQAPEAGIRHPPHPNRPLVRTETLSLLSNCSNSNSRSYNNTPKAWFLKNFGCISGAAYKYKYGTQQLKNWQTFSYSTYEFNSRFYTFAFKSSSYSRFFWGGG